MGLMTGCRSKLSCALYNLLRVLLTSLVALALCWNQSLKAKTVVYLCLIQFSKYLGRGKEESLLISSSNLDSFGSFLRLEMHEATSKDKSKVLTVIRSFAVSYF